MSWIGNGLRRLATAIDAPGMRRDPKDDFWWDKLGMLAEAGELVNERTALRVPAVFDCLRHLADPTAVLPLMFYRRLPDGNKERVDHVLPIASVFRRRPNDEQTAAEFRSELQFNLGLYRNAYAEILPGSNGVGGLVPIHPARVQRIERRNGRRWALVRDADQAGRVRPLAIGDELWHIRVPPLQENGFQAISNLELARDAIGRGIAVQNYGARFFKNDTRAGERFIPDTPFRDKDEIAKYVELVQAARAGANRFKLFTSPIPGKFENTGMTNEEAQFLETEKQAAIWIGRYWAMPPHKLGILDRSTFRNVEQQGLEFVVDALMPWLTAWEAAIKRDFIYQDDVFAEFNVLGLLRGDVKARFEAYAKARQWGWISVNEIRALENMNGIGAAGETYLEPMNMRPVGESVRQAEALTGKILEAVEYCQVSIRELREAQAADPDHQPAPFLALGGSKGLNGHGGLRHDA